MPILNLWPADLNLHHHKPSRGGPTLKAVRHPAAGAAYSFCFDSLLSPKKNRPSLFAGPALIIAASSNKKLQVFSLGNLPLVDRKSTRLNSSHVAISYAVFCLKKKTECGK